MFALALVVPLIILFNHRPDLSGNPDRPWVGGVTALSILFIVFVWGAIATQIRVARQRSILQHSIWRRVPAQYKQIPGYNGARKRPLLLRIPGNQPTVMAFIGQPRWTSSRAGLEGITEIDIAGEIDHYAVVRAPDQKILSSVVSPKSSHMAEYRAAFGLPLMNADR